MHVLKSAILAIFQKSADCLDWPCPVSSALHFHSQDLFSIFIYLFEYETIVRRTASSFGHSDPDPRQQSANTRDIWASKRVKEER